MKMKKIMSVLLTLACVTSMSACGGGDKEKPSKNSSDETVKTESKESKEVTEISFLHIWPEHEQDFEQIIGDFEEENPDIKVNTSIVPWSEILSTTQNSFVTGDTPDVSFAWMEFLGGYNDLGQTLDLTPYLDENNGEWRNVFLKSALDLGTVNGQAAGIPFRMTAPVLCYNKTMLEEHNWKLPETLEAFEALNPQVVEAGITPVLAPGNPQGFQLASMVRTFAEFELYQSGKLQKEDYLAGLYTEVGDEYAKAAERGRTWLDNGWVGKDSLAIQREEAQSLFFTGKGLFFFANNNELTALRDLADESGMEVDFIGFPTFEGMPGLIFNLGADGFFVSNQTEHPDQAVRFLKYITSNKVQKNWGETVLSLMSNQNVEYLDPDQKTLAEIVMGSESYRMRPGYNQGNLITDLNVSVADFLAEPSMTPEEYGRQVQELFEKVKEENYKG